MKLKGKFFSIVAVYGLMIVMTTAVIISNIFEIKNIFEISSKNNSFISSIYKRREQIKTAMISNNDGGIGNLVNMPVSGELGMSEENENIQGCLEDIYEIEKRILKTHSEKKGLESTFEEDYKKEKQLRHILQDAAYAEGDYEETKLMGMIIYKSKEAIFQYRDEAHFLEWQDNIEKFSGIVRTDLRGYTTDYMNIAKSIGGTALLIKDKEEQIEKLLLEYQETLYKLDDCIVAFKADQDKTFKKEMTKVFASTIATVFTFFIIAGVMGMYFNKRIIKPLTRLTKATKMVGDKNFNHKMEICSDDEIGELVANFNNMTDMLRSFWNEMDDKVISRTKEIEALKDKFEKLSITDELTQIYNRRKIDEVIREEFERAKRYEKALSIIIIDIDKFKAVNDTYGHDTGDRTLKKVANIIKDNIRNIDNVGRWGGEEFIVACPETDNAAAQALAERIRMLVESHAFDMVGRCTISLGVSSYIKGDASMEKIISRADEALYRAKKEGRNRVNVSEEHRKDMKKIGMIC